MRYARSVLIILNISWAERGFNLALQMNFKLLNSFCERSEILNKRILLASLKIL